MNGIRKSSRLRKPITTIDQNLENDDDAFIPTKKRPSTDDHDQIESPAPARKRVNRRKTSPYFQKQKNVVKKRKKSDENQKVVEKRWNFYVFFSRFDLNERFFFVSFQRRSKVKTKQNLRQIQTTKTVGTLFNPIRTKWKSFRK